MPFPTTTDPFFTWGEEEGQFKDIRNFKAATLFGPAVKFSKITVDATGLVPLSGGPTRAIWADTAGTLTGHDAFGNAVSGIPLVTGWNSLCLAGVTSITTTTQVWAVY
jgi:hypothetical protein